ncbi:MAG: M28 family peptidase, partial [Solirubrobacterales bacterium]
MQVAERIELIRELCAHEGRRSGTDAERRAANVATERLRVPGRRVAVEPIHVHPQLGLIYGLYCVAAICASLVALVLPVAGFAAMLVVATLLYLDANGRLYTLRQLLFRRASQNVISRPAAPGGNATLVLSAHVDVGRSGALYWAKSIRGLVSLGRRLRIPVAPLRILFAVVVLGLIPLGIRSAGVEATWLDALQLAQVLVLLLALFLLIDLELSKVGPGANDNASGVATAVSLVQEVDGERFSDLDVWVVLTGGEEPAQEGMRAFMRSHRRELTRSRTYFLNLDAVGRGRLRYETRAGWIAGYAMGDRLAQLCEAHADAELDEAEDMGGLT